MEEIPEDVMKRIDAAVEKYGNQPVVSGIKMAMADVLSELVAEERERCAKVADEQRARCIREGDERPSGIREYRFAAGKAGEIATSIRNPKGYLNSEPTHDH
jgi:hypothetical protein